MRDEDLALFLRQLGDGLREFVDKRMPSIERLRSSIGRRQQVFELQHFIVLVRNGAVTEIVWLLLAEQVRDSITRDAKEPAGDVIDRHQQAVRFYQLIEDV